MNNEENKPKLQVEKSKKLSDVFGEEFNFMPVLFIKFFSESNHRDDFIRGNVYSNNFDYMVQCEKREGRGRGDAYEGINVISNAHLKFYKDKTDELMFEATVGANGLTSKITDSERMHMFCTTGVFPDWFEVISQTDKEIKCNLNIPEYFQELMKQSFGKYVVVYSPEDFKSKLDNYREINKLSVEHGKVVYLDYSVNPSERIKSFIEGSANFYFQKDTFFDGQQEYRFLFPTLISDKAEILNLNANIEYIADIETVEDLINYKCEVVVNLHTDITD
ncbi:hypothetical protein [Trichococcus flocculiformis]|uniref:hypothetical protein n=1 Tax=Trichococcus flocculiformis TaxID=82803 RepID=UPI003DA626E5